MQIAKAGSHYDSRRRKNADSIFCWSDGVMECCVLIALLKTPLLLRVTYLNQVGICFNLRGQQFVQYGRDQTRQERRTDQTANEHQRQR